jgi:hypothetical protein
MNGIAGLALGIASLGAAAQEPTSSDWTAMLARMAELERLVAEQARRLELLEGAPPAAAVSPVPEARPESPAPALVPHTADFLPSRGRAGGTLHYGGDELQVIPHGFVDLEYVDAQAEGSRGGVSTFDSPHSNVFFTTQVRPDLRAHVELEFEHSGTTVETDQAYVAWRARDWLELTGGRFYTPFGIERFVWYSPTNTLVSRPEALRQIVPGNFYGNGLKLSGLVRQGGHARFTYELALTDGLGERALTARRDSRQDRDNNSNRALTGRASLVLWPGLEAGASFHTQRYATAADLGLRFTGFDLSARRAGFELRAEHVRARVDRAAAPALRQDGWYAQLDYTLVWDRELLPSLSLVARREGLDLDDAVRGSNDTRRTAFGLNAKVYEHFRAKLEFQRNGEDGPRKRDDAFLGQLVVDF